MDPVTLDSLKARFGELLLVRLTDDNGIGVIDETKTAPAIAGANGEVYGYLRDRYQLPLVEVPPELAKAAENMALEAVYSSKPERETPKDVKDRAAAALTWLDKVKKGLATLSIATLAPAAGSSSETGSGFFKTSKKKSDRIFSDDKLNSFTR